MTGVHADDAVAERLTPERFERMRARVGVPSPRVNGWNLTASEDSVRQFAHSIGDDNPLWCDPPYAETTRWRGVIAPPTYVRTMGIDTAPRTPPAVRRASEAAFRGIHQVETGSDWTFHAPVRPGDRVYRERWIERVDEKQTRYGGGLSALIVWRELYGNHRGDVVAVHDQTFIGTDRQRTNRSGQAAPEPAADPSWDDDSFAEIEAMYAAEARHGADPRWWEDIQVGDSLPARVKGPLLPIDIIAAHMGMGWGGYAPGTMRMAHLTRARWPALYVKGRYGVPDVAQRLHWDDERARTLGSSRPYDYGRMRVNWLGHLLTDWVGDHGLLHRLDVRITGFNYHGDVTFCEGEISARDDSDRSVTVAVRCRNHRDEVTAKGTAVLLLPSRSAGPAAPRQAQSGLTSLLIRRASGPVWHGAEKT